jgi:iron complex outermembrane receptor protein
MQKVIFEEGIPQQNVTASATYAFGRVKLGTHARYYGAWTDSTGNTTGNLTQRFGAVTFVDVRVDVDLTSNLSVAVGADNIFDKYPDEALFQASRGLIYSRNAPYGTDGGSYYLRLNARF